MNIFLACFLAVILARLAGAAFSLTMARLMFWRMRRYRPVVLDVAGADEFRAQHNEFRAQLDADLAIAIAADAYALAPGQGTLDQLTEAAAAFGKVQTQRSREMRLCVAEMHARMPSS